MADATPAHVGDVQKTVDTAEVDEGAEVRDVLDSALSDLTDLELLEKNFLLELPLLLEHDTSRDDDVPPALVDLKDAELELLPEQLLEVRYAPERHLRTRQERLDAEQVDLEAALDPTLRDTFNDLLVVMGFLDLVPDLEEVGLALRDLDLAVCVLRRLKEHADLVTNGQRLGLGELIYRDPSF